MNFAAAGSWQGIAEPRLSGRGNRRFRRPRAGQFGHRASSPLEDGLQGHEGADAFPFEIVGRPTIGGFGHGRMAFTRADSYRLPSKRQPVARHADSTLRRRGFGPITAGQTCIGIHDGTPGHPNQREKNTTADDAMSGALYCPVSSLREALGSPVNRAHHSRQGERTGQDTPSSTPTVCGRSAVDHIGGDACRPGRDTRLWWGGRRKGLMHQNAAWFRLPPECDDRARHVRAQPVPDSRDGQLRG